MTIDLYAFDAYGTLFDVHSAVARHRALVGGEADRLSDIWRTKQLEYTWTRSLMGAHRDFAQLTAEALDFAAARCGGISATAREKLLSAYDTLDAFADVAPTLSALKARGAKLVILSNGTPAMLESAVRSAGLGDLLETSLSVESVGIFKTDRRVYDLVGERFGVAPAQVSFQSSNRWDAAAAARYGFRTVWINRAGAPDEYADMPPAATLRGLAGLLDL